MSSGSDGKILRSYLKKLVNELVDIRNIPDQNADIEKKARTLAVNIIQTALIDRLSNLNANLDQPNEDEYE
jgi:hypothetical protein